MISKKLIPHTIKHNDFSLTNYLSNGYFPEKKLQKGLLETIILPEQTMKKSIPNGSIWVYEKSSKYKPEILRTDVGCGMTIAKTNLDIEDSNLPKKIIKTLKKYNIKIGRGNHFLDILNGFPNSKDNNSILLHSDFNLSNDYIGDFETALKYTQKAKDKRKKVLEIIFDELKADYKITNDWTHNSVEILDDKVIYRKGAINLDDNDGIGLLALNPFDGVYVYSGENKETYNSMQHGVGKKSGIKADMNKIKKAYKEEKYLALDIENSKKPNNLYKEYNDFETFLDTFRNNQFQIIEKPILKPKYVIYTG